MQRRWQRRVVLSLLLLATVAGALELAPTPRNTSEGLGQITQWAPSGNFSALHGRAVFRREIRSESRPYARARGEVAAGFGIFLSRDSIGASSYLSTPNGLGPWSYANLNPARYTDPDGRDVGFAGCLALEKSGKGDVGTCMRGLIDPNRKRYFPRTPADEPPATTGARAFGEGALERAGSYVMVPSELAINSIGFDPDFNPISAEKQQQAKAAVDEMQAGIRNRVWFPPLLVKDAFVGGGTAIAEFGSAAVDGNTRALGAATVEVGVQAPAVVGLFEVGVAAGPGLLKGLGNKALGAVSPEVSIAGALDGMTVDEAMGFTRQRHADFQGPWRGLPATQDWWSYLEDVIGPPDPAMSRYRPHAHHIVFKEGIGEVQQAAVEAAQDILKRRAGIDPIWSRKNLTWAPNVKGQHIGSVIDDLLQRLRALDAQNATPADFEAFLRKAGEESAKRGIK